MFAHSTLHVWTSGDLPVRFSRSTLLMTAPKSTSDEEVERGLMEIALVVLIAAGMLRSEG